MLAIGISFILFSAAIKDVLTFRVAAGHMDGIEYYLSTRIAKDVAANRSGETLFGRLFDPKKNTKILIHGFMDHKKGLFIPHVTEAYLKAQDVNVIGVDWSWWMADDYLKITKIFLPVVAKRIASFVKMLVEQYGTDLTEIHFIGHSLGAHTSGMVGLLVQKYIGKKLGRITGLDPASQGFIGEELKLTKHCAEFVDTVHSDDYGLGSPEMNSHVDFYINGGNSQPKCGSLPGDCSHNMAHEYWGKATLNETAFLAVKCDSWLSFSWDFCCHHEKTYLGERTSRKSRGAFYLATSSEPPYGLGKEGVRLPPKSSYFHYLYTPYRSRKCV